MSLAGGHGDYLGELLSNPAGARYPELTVKLIEQFPDEPTTGNSR